MVAERENKRLTEEIRKYLKRKLRKVAIINTTGYILTTLNSREDRIALLIPVVKIVTHDWLKPGFHELYPSFIYFTFVFCYVCQVLLWWSCVYLGYIKFTMRRRGTVFLNSLVSSACIFNSSFIF